MYDINNMPQSIEIGYTGETNYRTIEIDMSKWLETMPDGYPSIVHICPGKTTADAYIANTTFADGILSWTISASDLGATEGTGLAQVWMEAVENYTLNKEGRSVVFATIVRQSLSDEDPTVPPSQLPWLEQMTLLKTQTLIASDEAKAAQTEATAAATTAESAAATAESAATTASGAATDASDYAGQALASKGDAEAAATAAAESATDASGSASAAGDSADASAASATAAAGSAADALSYRNAASGYANTASGAATTAVGSATAAEAWATGGSGGTPTATNNAKYYADLAEETVSRYEGLTVEATTLEPGEEATAEITEVSGHMNIAFGLPQGEKGEQGERGYSGDKGMDGVSPEVTVTTITGGHRVAVTDAEGTSTFDVMDGATGPTGPTGPAGQDGQDGQDGYTPVRGTDYWTAEDKAEIVGDVEDDIIDDTAGEGDTGKTWSADKLSEETTFEKTLTQASIQSFEGGAWPMGMQIAVDPVQDLHGYSNPWPGGGGKNLFGGYVEATTRSTAICDNITGTYRITATATTGNCQATYSIDATNIVGQTITFSISGHSNTSGAIPYVCLYKNGSTSVGDLGSAGYGVTKTSFSWTVASDTTSLMFLFRINQGQDSEIGDYLELTGVQLEIGSSATQFEPYSNICTITGWTGANVTVTGKNLFDKNSDRYGLSINTTTNAYQLGTGKVGVVNVKPNTTYTVSKQAGNSFRLATSKIKPAVGVEVTQTIADHTGTELQITTGSQDYWIGIYGWSGTDTVTEQEMFNTVQCEIGSVKTAYEPYAGTTYSITFPASAGTVYGGELTIHSDGSGKLVVDKASETFVDSTGWTLHSAGDIFYHNASEFNGLEFKNTAITNNGINITEYNFADIRANPPAMSYNQSNNRIYLHVGANVTTLEQLSSWFSSNNTQLVSSVSTPIIYSLTPGQVLSLLGKTTNVWADTGDILSLTYNSKQGLEFIREDTAGQIASVVNPVKEELADTEAAMAIVVDGDTAPKNITSGQYVFVKNHSTLATGMYHATAAIASGASITSSNVDADADGVANALATIQTVTGITKGTKANSANYISAELCGKTACIKGYFSINDSLAVGDVLFNIPSGIQPVSGRNYFVVHVTNTNKFILLTIGSQIKVESLLGNTFASGDVFTFSYYYFI